MTMAYPQALIYNLWDYKTLFILVNKLALLNN
jgi:hypothetical protein